MESRDFPEEDRPEELEKMEKIDDDSTRPDDDEPGEPSVTDAFRSGM